MFGVPTPHRYKLYGLYATWQKRTIVLRKFTSLESSLDTGKPDSICIAIANLIGRPQKNTEIPNNPFMIQHKPPTKGKKRKMVGARVSFLVWCMCNPKTMIRGRLGIQILYAQ